MVIILHRSARASRRKTGRRSHVSAAGACGWPGSSSAVEGELRREKHLTSSLPALNHSSLPPGAACFPGRIRVRVRARVPAPPLLLLLRFLESLPSCCRDLVEPCRAVILAGSLFKAIAY
uniref:Uncharacterized protein n=1 Tax=Rangifer tarandus platyrhynchus TaxID=3082113 RepID=A0ACB0FLD8_RANTA|nr:unnamed protein product [Rangifer tarandus platyrhynchus]